ncbi:hypothetical protein FBUS_08216 [Fasciolopsis buskii]|uniref:Uncharacterized protein n=1 Tax=Fasciolopsis buskii TaxID=27845 RepID=A0A8E0S1K6_9TREM|nr:hypothetical protein FBUS_08216 [Fasciolopsis buski]
MPRSHGYKHEGSGFIEAYRYMFGKGTRLSPWHDNGSSTLEIAPKTVLKYAPYKRLLASKNGPFESNPEEGLYRCSFLPAPWPALQLKLSYIPSNVAFVPVWCPLLSSEDLGCLTGRTKE